MLVRLAVLCALVVAWTSALSVAQETREIPLGGDRLSGVVLPVEPRDGAVLLSARRADAWAVDDTRRLLLQRDVTVAIGGYTFDAERAVVWINRLPSADGVVTQVAMFLPTFLRTTAGAAVSAEGNDLLVLGSTKGDIHMRVDLMQESRPRGNVALLDRAEERLLAYLQGVLAAPPALARDPILDTGGRSSIGAAATITLPVATNPRHWLRRPGSTLAITAQRVELTPGEQENVIVATGNVMLELRGLADAGGFEELQLTARRAVIFTDPAGVRDIASGRIDAEFVRGLYLEGNVVADANRGDYLARAPRAYYDFDTGQAMMLEAVLRTYARNGRLPIYARAQELRQQAANQWTARRARISTSGFTTPDLSIGAEHLTLTREARDGDEDLYVTSTGNTLRMGRAPVLWWPYYSGRAGRIPLEGVRLGWNKTRGTQLETRLDLPTLLGRDAPSGIGATLRADGYSKRGAGLGLDLEYQLDFGGGTLDLYGMTDSGRQKTASGRQMDVEDHQRGYVLWSHKGPLGRTWDLQAQASWISDPTFMSAWRIPEYRSHREYETSLYLKRQEGNSAFTALAKYDLDGFISTSWLMASRQFTVDRAPEFTFRQIGESLFGGAVTWDSTWRYSRMRMRLQDGTPESMGLREAAFAFEDGTVLESDEFIADPLRARDLADHIVNRFSTRHDLAMQLDLGPLRISPFLGAAATWSLDERSTVAGEDRPARTLLTGGVRASAQFNRVWNNVESRLLDLHRLRHVVEPYATLWFGDSSVDPTQIEQYDPLTDNIAEGTAAWMGVRNRLQTWRGGPGRWYQVDWITIDTALLIASEDATQRYDTPAFYEWRPEYSSLSDAAIVNAKWQISDALTVLGHGTWELDGGQMDRGSLSVQLDRGRDARLYLSYREIRITDAQFLDLGLQYDLTKRYTIDVRPRWNFARDDLQSLRLLVVRHYPEFDLVGFVTYSKIQDETQIGGNLRLLKF